MKANLFASISATAVVAGLIVLLLLPACSTNVALPAEVANAAGTGDSLPAVVTAFLEPDASKLCPGPVGGAALVWINPNVQWTRYSKVLLKPVQFWVADDSRFSPTDQQALTAYFYDALKTEIQKSFSLIDRPGPGVITLEVALMDATRAIPGLRSASAIVPQLRILSVQSPATKNYPFLASTEAEMKATDAVTDELLAEAVDQRARGPHECRVIAMGRYSNDMEYRAVRIPQRLQKLKLQSASNQ